MSGLRTLLTDSRRRQRGSVLSGVLIITAFVAIIAGALMTELSTNFLLSSDLGNRVANEATVNSVVELTLEQMLTTPLNNPCPTPAAVTNLNSRSAVASYQSCWPTVDVRTQPAFKQIIASTSAFTINGTHAQLNGLNDYVVGNAGGTVYDFTFGSSTPRWSLALGGQLTAPPLVIPNPHAGGQFLDVIPMAGPACSPNPYCLSVRSDNLQPGAPPLFCTFPLLSAVVSRPAAASAANAGMVYFVAGTSLYAVDVSSGGGQCDWEANSSISGTQPLTAGPIAFACASGCPNGTDEVYAVASDATSSQLIQFSYRSGNLQNLASIAALPPNAAGIASSGSSLPARAALTFSGGSIKVVQLAAGGSMTQGPVAAIGAGIGDAPYWCALCGNVIGVGGLNGGLYLYDSNLSPYATFPPPGAAIRTTPAADGAGDWYYGADDGYVHELQLRPGNVLTQVRQYGPMAPTGSSVQVGACSAGICVYLGDAESNAYLISLDARDAVITACIGASASNCSGQNPRLWATVEVGANALQTVHVGGWSYFSP